MSAHPEYRTTSRYLPDIDAFERGRIDPDRFDQRAHVYVAWLYLQDLSLPQALARFSDALRRLTRSLGAPGKYHETISWFFMILIAERRAGAAADDWQVFEANNQDLITNARLCLTRHYSKSRLNSADARQQFLLPDLALGS